MTDPNTISPLAAGQIEIWKKIVDVQQHFNDLELRIRNFALIVTGAFLGLGGYAIKDAGVVRLLGMDISIAGLVVFCAIFPLLAFYFMDRLWYHRLLEGAVKAGIDAETALKVMGYNVDLGVQISAKSPFKLWLFGKDIHSKTKMDIFYLVLVIALLIVAVSLGFGIHPQPTLVTSQPPVVAPSTSLSSSLTSCASPVAEPTKSTKQDGVTSPMKQNESEAGNSLSK